MTAAQLLARPLRPLARAIDQVRQRIDAWWSVRTPRTDTLLLTQRNIYIVPTRAGLMYALTLLVLLLASINYQLNLGYMLTFLLAGSGLVSMHITHNTLRGLTLHLRAPSPVFAGDAAVLEVVLTSALRPRYGIGLRSNAGADPAAWSWLDVPKGAQASAHLGFVTQRRGLHDVPPLRIETRFPLGLFRAWTVWRPAAHVLVYPQPERPTAALPAARAADAGTANARRVDGDEVEGVRAYRRGDPLKLVVWKKVARSGEMVSRDSSESARRELWLDYQQSGALHVEARLSRLTAWVLAADRATLDYGLRLPRVELRPAHGEAHRRACLDALAQFQ
jgi:uncharacterized protein (DUF58 family)